MWIEVGIVLFAIQECKEVECVDLTKLLHQQNDPFHLKLLIDVSTFNILFGKFSKYCSPQ